MDKLGQILKQTGVDPTYSSQLPLSWSDLESESRVIFQAAPRDDEYIKWVLTLISKIIQNDEELKLTLANLFVYLEEHFEGFDSLDKGIYWHLKGYLAWKFDRSLSLALTFLNRSREILNAIPSPQAMYYNARVSNTFGQISYASGHIEDAIIDFTDSLTHREKENDLYGRALTLGNLGRLHLDKGDYEMAVKYLKEDLSIIEDHFPSKISVRVQLLSHLGRCYLEKEETDQAINCYSESLELSEQNDYPLGILFACLGLGEAAIAKRNYIKAESWCEKIRFTIRQHFHDQQSVFDGLASHLKGLVQQEKGDLEQANLSLTLARNTLLEDDRISSVQRARLLTDSARVSEALGDDEATSDFLSQALIWLDKTSLFTRRHAVEVKLKEAFKDKWLLHSAMRFTGKDVETMLEKTGDEGFKGERKHVSVLFTDIRDFTKISETLSPEEVIEFLNAYLSLMIRTVDFYSGYVDKILGDSLMAVFSLPDATGSDTERAALTALVMLEQLKRLNTRFPTEFPVIRAGIGLHYGPVVSGLIGSARKRSYTVIGDVVNVASRLESLTKELKLPILASGHFRDALKDKDQFLWLPVGNWILYGRQDSIPVYSLVGENVENPQSTKIREQISLAEKGFHHFYNRQFKEASKCFSTLSHSNGMHPFQMFELRCQEYLDDPPAENWDGSFQMYGK